MEHARSYASQWLMYHTLRVDPSVQFDEHGHLGVSGSKEEQLKHQVASVMKRTYWDTVREELAKPEPDFSFLLSRVDELVDTMSGFLPQPRRDAFKEKTVDMPLLRTQVLNRAFDYASLLELVKRLCAALMELESPFQSARTQEWLDDLLAKPAPDDTGFRNDVVTSLAHLFQKCDVLRMDIENFGLQQVRATKLQGLERTVFADMVRLKILTLDVTRAWTSASEHNGNIEVAVIKGMAWMLTEKQALPIDKCPEPLRCDLNALHDFQSRLQGVALLGLVAIMCTPFFPTNIDILEASEVFVAVRKQVETKPKLHLICKALEESVADLRHKKGEAPVDLERFDAALGTLRTCLGEDAPAFRLLHDRACKAFVAGLGPPKQHSLPTSLGDSPWSLRFAVDNLNLLLDDVWTFLGDHLRVYRPMYSEALSSAGVVPP
eukprot:TRINITY_DN54328_c0_g1_i1.p1 TRINITY_DN54328_c0_g1~~TRINITY_DN54328_c0_g1_i1.p1  ORF type:complete len:484 (+),score=58.65 TRINITY_DN54328_c0_g1_i1:149-1453(+)